MIIIRVSPSGLHMKNGTIADAILVDTPRQRDNRGDKNKIKYGEIL